MFGESDPKSSGAGGASGICRGSKGDEIDKAPEAKARRRTE